MFQRSPDILETQVDNQVVLLNSTTWQYLHFTGSGAAIWQALAQPISFDDLIIALRKKFAVDESVCRRETKELLDKLLAEDFITTA